MFLGLKKHDLPTRVRTLEWLSTFAIILWGLILFIPGNTFDINNYYYIFKDIAQEEYWGFLCISIGFIRSFALYINGSWRPSPVFRALTSCIGATLWSLVLVSFLTANSPGISASIAAYAILFIMDIISSWRSGRDYADMERANGKYI